MRCNMLCFSGCTFSRCLSGPRCTSASRGRQTTSSLFTQSSRYFRICVCHNYYNYIKQDCNVCFACFRTYANLCLNFQLVLRWSHVIHKLAGGIESGISFWHCLFIGLSSHSSEIYFCAIAWQLLTVCQQNFMRTINTKRRCA